MIREYNECYMLKDEQIITNLNLTGNFLEAKMFSELIKSKHFLVTAEWPFTQPTFQGTADIIALNHKVTWDTEPFVVFAIECKKVKSDQKVWVFDRSRSKSDILSPFVKIQASGSIFYEDNTGYIIPGLDVSQFSEIPLFNKGYEFREKDGNLNRNESEKIYNSLTQANKALIGICKSDYKKIFKVSESVFESRHLLVVPIVITNAVIKTVEYQPDDIDIQTGEIDPKKVKFSEKDWVIFDYPLADDVQVRGNYKGSIVQPIKRPTIIVNASKAIEVMQEICNSSE